MNLAMNKKNPCCSLCNESFAVKEINFGYPTFSNWENKFYPLSRKYVCAHCEYSFVYPSPSEEDLAKFYDSTYRDIKEVVSKDCTAHLPIEMAWSENSFLRAQNFVNIINESDIKLKKDLKHLDIGGYQGLFGWALSKIYSSNPLLSDYSGDGLAFASKYLGMKVIKQDILFDEIVEKFEIISLVQVLEHVTNPVKFLLDIREKLIANDGYIFIEVPNIYKFPLTDPAHLSDFSKNSLITILKNTGFEAIKIKTHGYPQLENFDNFEHTISVIAKPVELTSINPQKKHERNNFLLKLHVTYFLNEILLFINGFKNIFLNSAIQLVKLPLTIFGFALPTFSKLLVKYIKKLK